ncbi:MAG: 4Fe-4S binding protein [Heliobacteriaceae bacterium]|jgi:2-oxoglutarate ferredoxin oxidoreductase subunit delta|nr:4Fe-4S binding protein [Heliobacteriaceae bacterium]
MGQIVIDPNKCKACYLCVNECPKGLIKVGEKLNISGERVVEFDDSSGKCIGCAMCAVRCPDLAITEVYR